MNKIEVLDHAVDDVYHIDSIEPLDQECFFEGFNNIKQQEKKNGAIYTKWYIKFRMYGYTVVLTRIEEKRV